MDVTPSKKDLKEKREFHKILKNMCDRHNKSYYAKYKKWCDEYFFLPHRNEPRGIGGIFFDYKKDNFEKDFIFVRDVGVTFQKIFNDKGVLYVGRMHDLKGAAWLPEIAKALPHISFKVVCPRDQRSFRNIPNLTFLSSTIPKSELPLLCPFIA